jgi:diguanylate cyclase (GGDEF)-like protein
MPQNVVLRTVAFFAALLAAAETAMVVFYAATGEAMPERQPVLVAILASIIVLPVICHSVLHAERNRAVIARLASLAETDALSGLLNRAGFFAALERLSGRLQPGESAGAVLYVDADHFKAINDRYGHQAGDRALSVVGAALRCRTRATDICGRLGGEEFAVLLRGANLEQAHQIAERIRAGIEEDGSALGLPGLRLTVSIGVALHEAGETLDACIRAADLRLYEAKAAGRNRVACHLELVREG